MFKFWVWARVQSKFKSDFKKHLHFVLLEFELNVDLTFFGSKTWEKENSNMNIKMWKWIAEREISKSKIGKVKKK